MSRFIDLKGCRFGRLVVKEVIRQKGKIYWECLCDCGNKVIVSGCHLRSGHTQSCGCLQRERTSDASRKDLSGETFGNLVVLCRISDLGEQTEYLCSCSCGNTVIVKGCNLVTGKTKSCGCYRSTLRKTSNIKHNGCYTRLYKTWRNMLDRCNNSKNKEYHRYGGRGIKVCEEWEKNFSNFRDWAFSSGYSDDLTIDRVNNEKGYCPSNCQWLTRAENSAKIKADRNKMDWSE